MAKIVGIVGAAGDVGRDLVAELLRISTYHLVLADIREHEASDLAKAVGHSATSMRVDVNEPQSLAALCRSCDVVVSTTGPSAIVRDNVAAAALRFNLPYVDLGGSIDLYDALSEKHSEIRDRGLSYLVSAGFSPGLTGTLPRYLMSRPFFDQVESFQMTLALQERMSYVATHDMLSGFRKRKMAGYWSDGQWKQDGEPVRVSLPSPIGQVEAKRIVEAEIREFVEREHPGYFALNTCVLGELQKLCFEFIVSQGLYEDPEQKKAAAQFLSKIITYELRGKEPILFLSAEARGSKDARRRSLCALLKPRDGVSFAASCAAVYVRMLAEGEIERKGRCWASEAADPEKYMAHLGELGIHTEITEIPDEGQREARSI